MSTSERIRAIQAVAPFANVDIKLGGGGKEAGNLQIASGFDIKHHAEFRQLMLDTDSKDIESVPKKEKFLMNDFPAADFIRELEQSNGKIPGDGLQGETTQFTQALGGSESITAGLQTHRKLAWPLMSFYLLRYAIVLFYFILQPFRELLAYRRLACGSSTPANIQDRERVRITMCGSLCGGTGSGLLLPIADLCHYLVPHRAGISRYVVEADLFLPGPMTHRAVNVDLLLANTYASQLELCRRYQHDSEQLSNVQLGPISLERRQPFRHMYLYGDVNLFGSIFTERSEVCQVRNTVYELRNFGIEGAEYHSRLADIHFKYPNIFSAAGACILEFDSEHYITKFGYLSANAYIEQLVRTLPDDACTQQAQSALETFLNQHPTWNAVPKFAMDASQKPLRMQVEMRGRGQQIKQRFSQLFDQQKEAWQETLNSLLARSVQQQTNILTAYLETVMNEKAGFQIGMRFLVAIRLHLQDQLAQVNQHGEATALQMQQSLARMKTPQKGWRTWFSLKSGKTMGTGLQRVADAQLNQYRNQVQRRYLEQMIAVIDQMSSAGARMHTTLVAFQKLLLEADERYAEAYEKSQSVAVIPAICPDQAARWYEQKADEVSNQVREKVSIAWKSEEGRFAMIQQGDSTREDCLILSEEAVQRHLEVCMQPWEYLADLSIEEILRKAGRRAEDVFAELEKAAAPLVSLSDEKQIPAAQRLLVLATESNHFFSELPAQTGLSVISTGNKQRISLLYTIHGLAADQLKKFGDYKAAYDKALLDGRSLHVYPDMEHKQAARKPKKRGRKKTTKVVDESSTVAPENA